MCYFEKIGGNSKFSVDDSKRKRMSSEIPMASEKFSEIGVGESESGGNCIIASEGLPPMQTHVLTNFVPVLLYDVINCYLLLLLLVIFLLQLLCSLLLADVSQSC